MTQLSAVLGLQSQHFLYRILQTSGPPPPSPYNDGVTPVILRGVLNQPVVTGQINSGGSQLELHLDHYPSELPWGCTIGVHYPDGSVLGYWRYHEDATTIQPSKTDWLLRLSPLSADLNSTTVSANYTNDTGRRLTNQGPKTFDTAVNTGIATVPTTVSPPVPALSNDGNSYAYFYDDSTLTNALNQAVTWGGGTWWWYLDNKGLLSLRNSSPYTHVVTWGRDYSAGEWVRDIHNCYTTVIVTGGVLTTAPAGTQAFRSVASSNNAGPPDLRAVAIGTRTYTFTDTNILDQTTCDRKASALLAQFNRVRWTRKIKLVNYALPSYGVVGGGEVGQAPRPGDAIKLREPQKPGVAGSQLTTVGPYLITKVTQYGNTGNFDLEVSGDLISVVPTAVDPFLRMMQAGAG